MTTAGSIKAIFIERATLTIAKNLIGNLPAEGGTVSPAEGPHEYDRGAVVSVSATAAPGWRFKNWSGAASGTTSPVSVTLNTSKTLTAHFIQRHTVTTEVVVDGYITPASGTWDHGATASFKREKGNPNEANFDHWSGLPESFSTP
jgi:hypothetical protein